MRAALRSDGWRCVALLVVLTLWIDFGRFHASTTADTLIPVFASVVEWTPFYWEQDRYGMLVALLATPIEQPLANLVTQSAFTIFAGLASFPLLARYFVRGESWAAIGLASVAWMAAFSDHEFPSAWLSITMFYAPALALGLAGLQLIEDRGGERAPRWRWAPALVLISLAHWVNFSICIILVLLFAARAVGDPSRELAKETEGRPLSLRLRALRSPRLLAIVAGAGAGRLVMTTAPASWRTERYGFLPPSEWLTAWTTAVQRRDFGVGPWALYILVPVALALAAWWWRGRPRGAGSPLAPLMGIGAAVLYALVVEATDLARLGNYPARYLVMSVAVVTVLAVGVAISVGSSLLAPSSRRFLLPASACIAALAVALRFGAPSWSTVEASLDPKFKKRTEDIMRAKCTHLIGNYWEVWPSVFDAMTTMRRRGDDRILWAITLRSAVTEHRWRTVPPSSVTLCADKEFPADVAFFAAEKKLGAPQIIEDLPTIVVLRWPEAP